MLDREALGKACDLGVNCQSPHLLIHLGGCMSGTGGGRRSLSRPPIERQGQQRGHVTSWPRQQEGGGIHDASSPPLSQAAVPCEVSAGTAQASRSGERLTVLPDPQPVSDALLLRVS